MITDLPLCKFNIVLSDDINFEIINKQFTDYLTYIPPAFKDIDFSHIKELLSLWVKSMVFDHMKSENHSERAEYYMKMTLPKYTMSVGLFCN